MQLRPVHRDHPELHQARLGAQPQHLAEQASQRGLVALAKPRDRAVIGTWLAAITRYATSSTQARSIARDERRPSA
jgi:hypothetical protein